MQSPAIIGSIEQFIHMSKSNEVAQRLRVRRKVAIAIRNLGSTDCKDRKGAVQLLKDLGAQAILPLQETLLTNDNPKVRERARRSLDFIKYRMQLLKARPIES
jgi:hypothetical protein